MLKNINDIYGTPLAALDGKIGYVEDFYFDEVVWIIRHLIADTGSWLPGRQVLLAPHAFDGFGQAGEVLAVRLTKEQIENSPSIESHSPMTRRQENDCYRYYQWPTYWNSNHHWGSGRQTVQSPAQVIDEFGKMEQEASDDVHLRSAKSITGYEIETTDGIVGFVTGFLVDHKSWAIANLVVEIGLEYASKQILISVRSVKSINDGLSKIAVTLTRDEIQRKLEDKGVEAVLSHC